MLIIGPVYLALIIIATIVTVILDGWLGAGEMLTGWFLLAWGLARKEYSKWNG